MPITHIEIVLRLLTAALLGSAIGFERERMLWVAGIRTHMLVAVGACLLMIVSAYGFQNATSMPHVVLDPSRVAAQVVSGIGFLGAGAILLRGQFVKGLTTAASIWSVAAIGLAAGGGLYFAAGLTTGIILLTLAGIKPLETAYRARVQSGVLEIESERDALDPDDLKTLLRIRGSQLKRVVTVREGELDRTIVYVVRLSRNDIRAGISRIERAPGVQSVGLRKSKRVPDEE